MGLTAVSAKRKKAFNSGLKKLVGTLFVREVETLVRLSCVRDFFFRNFVLRVAEQQILFHDNVLKIFWGWPADC